MTNNTEPLKVGCKYYYSDENLVCTIDRISLGRVYYSGEVCGHSTTEVFQRVFMPVASGDAAPSPAEVGGVGLPEVFAYLLGEGPLDGVWFDEPRPVGAPPFWWRIPLRRAIQAQQSPARVEGELTDAISAAEAVRKSLADRYQQGIDTNSADMGGNCDWARLEGAVKVVTALRALNQRLAVKEGDTLQWDGHVNVRVMNGVFEVWQSSLCGQHRMLWQGVPPANTTHPVSDDQQAKDAANNACDLINKLRADGVIGDAQFMTLYFAIDAALSTTKQEG